MAETTRRRRVGPHDWHGGGPPEYQPKFNEEDVREARRVVAQPSAGYARVQRAKLALLLHEQPGIRSPVAARQLGYGTRWVRKWRKRWATEGFSLDDAPRSGRPRRFSPGGTSQGGGHRL